jgi:TonB family protein
MRATLKPLLGRALGLAGGAAIAGPPATVEADNAAYLLKHYPPRALAAREQGRVGFRIDLDPKARVMSCEVVESSGFPALDRETCAVVTEHARFKPRPRKEGQPDVETLIGYISWKLPKAAQNTAATPVAVADAGDGEKVVCKKFASTGSLVQSTRVCKTKRDWARQQGQAQQDWGAAQGQGWSAGP